MAIYEIIPTIKLSLNNELVPVAENLPKLVSLDDAAKTVFIDFSKVLPATISRNSPIDVAIHEMKIREQQMLLVEEKGNQIVGIISFQDVMSERPIRLMQEKRLNRSEITVDMLMQPWNEILAIDVLNLKNSQVGHIINTIKEHSAYYILVVKKQKHNKHLIKGLFSASQIVKQLDSDIASILTKDPETIVELTKERKF